MLDRWYDRLCLDIENLLAHWEMLDDTVLTERDCFPHTGEESGACSSYGNCAYKMLCESNDPDAWLDGNFVVRRWNPLTNEEK